MPDMMLRYDMRQPAFSQASRAEMYQAALAQCSWGENNGFTSVHISEHHGAEDGYLSAPLIFASAVASRTESLLMFISALIAPLHDPVQLVEDLTVLDIISQGRVIPIIMSTDFTFTVGREDLPRAEEVLNKVAAELSAQEVRSDNKIAKVSVVGVGMRSHAGVASQMFAALADVGINIQMITTSEIKISVIIEEKFLELAVRSLHSSFGLDKEPIDESVD